MIRCQKNLVGRSKLEKVLSHPSRPDLFSPGHLLHERFRHAPAFVGLNGRHESAAEQISAFGRMTFVVLLQEEIRHRLNRVLSKHGEQSEQERAFAVRAGAVQKPETLLANVAGQTVTGHALQVRD